MIRALWKPSPFFKTRGSYPVDMVVIHHIGSKAGKLYSIEGTIIWFTDTQAHKNPQTGKIENQVSAHYAVPREAHSDYDVVQFVKNEDIAYHAGESQWVVDGKTRKFINNYSIGIELEGDGNVVLYTDFQYDTLIDLVKSLREKFNIPESNIVGHEDIAPDRKVDPGRQFDWMRFRKGLNPPVISSVPASDTQDDALTPTVPSEKVPPEQFYMGGGTNKDGKRPNVLVSLLQAILSLFIRHK